MTATENDPGAWITVSTTDAFAHDDGDSRWRYWFDAQARYFDIGSGINQWLVRPGLGYQVNDSTRAWIGYARFRTRGRAGRTVDENRYWQQVDWRAGPFSLRARLEQRSVSAGEDLGLVARLRVRYVRPIGDRGNTKLVLAVEPFYTLRETDWGGDNGLRQNRVVVGAGWQVSEKLSMEAGYMNQYIRVDGGSDRSNHFVVLGFRLH